MAFPDLEKKKCYGQGQQNEGHGKHTADGRLRRNQLQGHGAAVPPVLLRKGEKSDRNRKGSRVR